MRRLFVVLAGSLVAFGQAAAKPEAPPGPPPDPTPVNAPAARTWDAAIDEFASLRIPIQTTDRDRGFFSTDQMMVKPKQGEKWSGCGKRYFGRYAFVADRVIYQVLVLGDGAASTVRVTTRLTHGGLPDDPKLLECMTTYVREMELEAAIEQRAETDAPRDATPVNASAGRAWDAALDLFASRRVPIRAMERASGFIGTDRLGVGHQSALKWADCGGMLGTTFTADRATYNVFVRGDSAASTVMVMIRWTDGGSNDEPIMLECTTRNVLERELETDIKQSAENAASRAGATIGETAAPGAGTTISASVARTWDAAVDAFASRAIPIHTMEYAGGFFVSDQVYVPYKQAHEWSGECGSRKLFAMPLVANRAIYNVFVRGDGTTSTAKVTIRWSEAGDTADLIACATTNVREGELEAAIKLGAETMPASDATTVGAPVGRTWDAVEGVLGSHGVPIRTRSRDQGFMATDPLRISGKEARPWANCGKMLGTTFDPDRATYNVFVRGDSVASSVKVTVYWTRVDDEQFSECKTKHVREAQLEAAIKQEAEKH